MNKAMNCNEDNYEYSCGAVLYTRLDGEIYYALVVAPDMVVGFPKGHMENGESELDTALREVYEETGVRPRIHDGFCERIEYELIHKPGVKKRVVYFVAEYDPDSPLIVPAHELLGILRVPYGKAVELLTHKELLKIIEKADKFIRES